MCSISLQGGAPSHCPPISSPILRSTAEWFGISVYFLNPKPTSDFALRRSLDNHPVFVSGPATSPAYVADLCPRPDTLHLLGLRYWFSPTVLTGVPPSLLLFSLASSMLLWITSKGPSPWLPKWAPRTLHRLL